MPSSGKRNMFPKASETSAGRASHTTKNANLGKNAAIKASRQGIAYTSRSRSRVSSVGFSPARLGDLERNVWGEWAKDMSGFLKTYGWGGHIARHRESALRHTLRPDA